MQTNFNENNSALVVLFTGFFHALLLTFILVILVNSLFYFSSLSEYHLTNFSAVITIVSVFWGGFKSCKMAGKKALFYSLGVGLMYLLFAILLSLFISEPMNFASLGLKTLYCLGAGVIGGIVAVSLS